ncbi:MAG TPA: hypothetical protein PKH79_08880 [Prolixibacteraceae bacterium]|nr:hypothetical protein [Prolixibacteraceae bacterium]HPS12520.1 hypothetical protein [Prolixibacteraceae bacterium]
MKKNLLFIAALMAGLSLSAGEVGKIDTLALGVTSTASPLTAGTIVAQTASVTMSIAFDDNYKSTSIVANDFTAISVDGNEFSNGIQGATNPKDANGGVPCNTLVPPVGGAALKLDVRADGFIYILHKASSHKAYTVFENGSAMGYDFAMNTTNTFLGSVFKLTIAGEGEFNYIPEGDTIQWPEKYVTGYKDFLAANTLTQIGAGGMGYIKFPVFKDCSYIVNANGSKLTCSGFYFSTTGTEKVELIGATNLTIDEGSSVVPTPVDSTATVTFVVDDSANKTGTDFKLKGSWFTATGVYDSQWNGGAEHTSLYDDGTHGDATAGDHIWSVALELVVKADVTWKWGFNINGKWGPSSPDPEFTVADTTAKTVTYVIPKSNVGINSLNASKTVVKTEYFNLQGAKLNAPVKGVNIVKKTMSDGSFVTSKIAFIR